MDAAINMVLRFYGIRCLMKTTVEIPDELYRRAKAEATLDGRKLKDLVEEGLRLILDSPRKIRRRPSLAGLTKRARHHRFWRARSRVQSQASRRVRSQ